MIIWIIEDEKTEVNDAVKAISAVAQSRQQRGLKEPLAVYWDATIEWEPSLQAIGNASRDSRDSAIPSHPNIVILDLFDRNAEFKAQVFLQALRRWEASQSPPFPAARVILWSVWTGLPDVDRFLREEPGRDLRVVSLKTKGSTALREAVAGCWQSWEEERYP
jgi:hypothetical protein